MMFAKPPRKPVVVFVWLVMLTAVVALSVGFEARWSTRVLLFGMFLAPMGVALLLGFGRTHSMTTHDMLYAIDNHDDRRPARW